MSDRPICIIGTGVAAMALMQELRRRDAHVPITAIAMDAGHYSYRPNFSAAMARNMSPADLVTEPAQVWSKRLDVELHAFARVIGIDVESRSLETTSGTIAYRDLVIATGSRSRVPELGLDARTSILVVDHLPGFSQAYPTLRASAHVAVLGAGLVGCELADDFARSGRRVTVFDPSARPLARLVPPHLSDRLAAALSDHGVRWEFGSTLKSVERSGSRLLLVSGPAERFLQVDAVVSAAGLVPNAEVAALAGLEALPAIPVDGAMATARPHIHAIGDVAQPPGGWRPFVAGAHQGARVLAGQLCGDRSMRFDGRPQPIAVKTRLFPLRLLPPGESVPGQWCVERDRADEFIAHFLDVQGRVQGYALGGESARSVRPAPALGEPPAKEPHHA
jgi:rubredoxin---NAD+ reductase